MLSAAYLASAALAGGLAWTGYGLVAAPEHRTGVADAIVGGRDEQHLTSAIRLFRASAAGPLRSRAARTRRARAEAALAAQRGGAHLRAQANTLLGVLDVLDAQANARRRSARLAAAAAAFREALRLEPENEQAATDLELLLGRTAPKHGRASAHTGGSKGGRTGRSHGAGRGSSASSSTGGGY
jgi:hypothetical protein